MCCEITLHFGNKFPLQYCEITTDIFTVNGIPRDIHGKSVVKEFNSIYCEPLRLLLPNHWNSFRANPIKGYESHLM